MCILASVYVKQGIQIANSQKHKGINRPHTKLMEDPSPDLNNLCTVDRHFQNDHI
jgi:hypothetical protein